METLVMTECITGDTRGATPAWRRDLDACEQLSRPLVDRSTTATLWMDAVEDFVDRRPGGAPHGPDHGPQFEKRPILKGSLQLGWRVRRPEATPRHQIGTRRNGGSRVDLKQCQVTDYVEQIGRSPAAKWIPASRLASDGRTARKR